MNLSRLEYNETHPDSGIKLLPQASLAWNRVHECKGASKIIFALWLAQKVKGTILWISEAHNKPLVFIFFERNSIKPDVLF